MPTLLPHGPDLVDQKVLPARALGGFSLIHRCEADSVRSVPMQLRQLPQSERALQKTEPGQRGIGRLKRKMVPSDQRHPVRSPACMLGLSLAFNRTGRPFRSSTVRGLAAPFQRSETPASVALNETRTSKRPFARLRRFACCQALHSRVVTPGLSLRFSPDLSPGPFDSGLLSSLRFRSGDDQHPSPVAFRPRSGAPADLRIAAPLWDSRPAGS